MSDLEIYRKARLGNSSGWGRKPALLIVDFTNGFNDPETFGGGNIGAAVEKTVDLLAAARRHRATPTCSTWAKSTLT